MNRVKRERWYSYDGQNRVRAYSHDRSTGPRRVASLVILLFLVLILIRLTSDTGRVERAATAIGLLPSSNKPIQDVSPNGTNSNIRYDSDLRRRIGFQMANEQRYLEWMSLASSDSRANLLRDAWLALMEQAPKQVVNLLACKVFATNDPVGTKVDNSDGLSMLGDWYTNALTEVGKWKVTELGNLTISQATNPSSELSSPLPELEAWLKEHENWFHSAAKLESSTEQTDPVIVGLNFALDKKLLRQVEDYANWKPMSEHIAFQRNWQRIEKLCEWIVYRPENFSRLSKFAFGQFGTELAALRGKPIRFDGTILRIDSDDSTPEYGGFVKRTYKVIWLRPGDGSSQPIRLYVPSVFVDPMIRVSEGEEVEVGGFFFKQLAYASKRGTDVGPIVMCAYLGPKGAAIANTFEDRFSTISLSLKDKPKWLPPIDYATPFGIIQNSLNSMTKGKDIHLSNLPASDETSISVPILTELQRYETNIHQLLEKQKTWTVSPTTALTTLSGWLTEIERLPIDRKNMIPGFDQSTIYRCTLSDFVSGTKHQLLCSVIPSAFGGAGASSMSSIRQPVQARGFASKCDDGSLRIWCHSLDWKVPGRSQEDHANLAEDSLKPELARGLGFLLASGWNLSWLDLLQKLQSEPVKSISPEEFEPFYSLLRLAAHEPFYSNSEANQNCRILNANEIIESLRPNNKQTRSIMERTSMKVRVLRVTKVILPNPAHVSLLGRDQYFQIDAMADIGNRTYQIPTEGEPILYDKEYPVTLVATELPGWLGPSNDDGASNRSKKMSLEDAEPLSSWSPRIKLTISGWFYRFWSYKTQEISQSLGENKRQISPLIVVDAFDQLGSTPSEQQARANLWANIAASTLGLFGVVGIWWYVRSMTQRKSKLRFETKRRDVAENDWKDAHE